METAIKSLSRAHEGTTVVLDKIAGEALLKRRLTELGFIVGEKIVVLHNTGKGSLIVNIKNAKFALGRGEAEKIFISGETMGGKM